MKAVPKKLCVGFLFDDTLDSDAGVAQYVKTLGAWMGAQGHTASYLVGETNIKSWAGGQVYSLAKNQTVYFNGNKLSIPLPARKKDLRPLLKRLNLDVLHVMTPYSPFMGQKVISLASNRTAVVGTFHIFPAGFLSKAGTRALRLVSFHSLKRFDSLISVSPVAETFAKSAFGMDSAVIPNPVDLRRFAASPASHKKGARIVFLGRLVKRKGARQLLDAFALLALRQPGARLVIAGDGPQRAGLRKMTQRMNLAGRVDFSGYIDESAKPALLAGADIACFPSLYGESFGIVLIEAMAAGAGVVLAGDNPGYHSLLADQPKLLIDPNDTEAFAERLEELLTARSVTGDLHRWQAQAVKQYDISVVGPRVLEQYRRAIARRSELGHN